MRGKPDKYRSLDELKLYKSYGKDYKEACWDRKSPFTLLSIHGGQLEFGTSEIAKSIAGKDYNLFDFYVMKRKKSWDYHITSYRFKHEKMDDLLKKSTTAVSIHGCTTAKMKKDIICIGGLDDLLKTYIKDELKEAGFSVNKSRFPGNSKGNVVNRAASGGVQIELTHQMRKEMFENYSLRSRKPNENFYKFTGAVRKALKKYDGLPKENIESDVFEIPEEKIESKIIEIQKDKPEIITKPKNLVNLLNDTIQKVYDLF